MSLVPQTVIKIQEHHLIMV